MIQKLICALMMTTLLTPKILFDFNKKADTQQWFIVDDGVMGGRSSGNFSLSNEGYGVFEGNISLDNNGGFSSLRYNVQKTSVKEFTKISLKLKGDGKKYQLRIKASNQDYHSYIMPFETSGEWEEIEISLQEMYPSFRGRILDMPTFANEYIEELNFLIGNKKKEKFKLLLDKIELK
jgi:hypothetical protein